MSTRMRQVTGGPTFCWHCFSQLQYAPGKGKGLYYAHIVTDAAGVEHRIHGDCLKRCLEVGCKYVKGAS